MAEEEAGDSRSAVDQRDSRSSGIADSAEDRIRAHNQELLSRTAQHLELALAVLTEQRDEALRRLATADERAEKQRSELCDEQERFITFLMEDHDQKVDALNRELSTAKQELERRRALAAEATSQRADPQRAAPAEARPGQGESALLDQIESLKMLLESAQAEVEDTRADAVRLQEERDDAIRATDDLRLELIGEVEAARDETFQLQTQLDETFRQLDDVRDEARDEAYRASEEQSELQRELDERHDEVRRLRARLAELTTEIKPSQPPPPAAIKELESARLENQSLRKQLIDAKRELSRASREAGLSRTSRGRRSGPLALRTTGVGDPKQGAATLGRAATTSNQPEAQGAKPSHSGPAELKPVAKPSSSPPAVSTPPRPDASSPQPTKTS